MIFADCPILLPDALRPGVQYMKNKQNLIGDIIMSL